MYRLPKPIKLHWCAIRQIAFGAVASVLLHSACAFALGSDEITALLKKADGIKTSSPAEFKSIVGRLAEESSALSASQLEQLRYLQAWMIAYDGDYEAAITALKALIKDSTDTTQRFRASAAVTNLQALASHYESAFSELTQLLAQLPSINDSSAREQVLGVAAQLYNQVGEYELGLTYAEKLAAENPNARSACRGAQMKLEALFKNGKLTAESPEFQAGIDTCKKFDEISYSNVIRAYIVRLYMDQGRFDEAVKLLKEHYDEVLSARYPRLIAQYNALLAEGYRETGNPALAKQFATRAVDEGIKNEYTQPLVAAYRMLYVIAKESGDSKAALAYHEKYTLADKGYLNDVSARQLAYQRVKHELDASHLQIEALNKQNQVLQLQGQLSDKAVENVRLYIILLTMAIAFIALWAYKTKRSQLHFMKLSQQDGLTGIFNRPHFIDQTTRALEASRKSGQEMCVVICDLDHFKAINDNWGHAAGDVVLKRAAAVFITHLRNNDIVGRLGGEEFGIALIDCNLAIARQRCDQLRAALAEIPVEGNVVATNLTASFGVATTAVAGHEFRLLLARADAALYGAKRAGRNRVMIDDANSAAAVPVVEITEGRLRA